jgi:hypothetical protein
MKISKDDFNAKLQEYAITVFIPSIKSMMRQLALYFIVSTGKLSTDFAGDKAMKFLGLMDENGLVDTDILRSAALRTMELAGPTHIEEIGFTLEKSDAVKFFDWLEDHAQAAA